MSNQDRRAVGDKVRTGGRPAPNRLVNQPIECNNAREDGSPSPATLNRYRRLARGGAGMTIIEAMTVAAGHRARRNQLVISPETAEGLAGLVTAIREIDPEMLIIFQLDHAGAAADARFAQPVAYHAADSPGARILSDDEIRRTGEDFVRAALIARQAGADGVDFKQCHGYFCCQLLRPANTRQGRYGGDWAGRTAFVRETGTALRRAVGDDFILGARMSFYEAQPGGFGTAGPDQVIEDPAEPLALAGLLEKLGFDFINVSGGSPEAEVVHPTLAAPTGIFRHFSWTAAVSIPVLGSAYTCPGPGGRLPSGLADGDGLAHWADRNLNDGLVDLIGLGRQSLADPDWAVKLLSGREADMDWCTCCGGCGARLGAQLKVGCVTHDPAFRKDGGT